MNTADRPRLVQHMRVRILRGPQAGRLGVVWMAFDRPDEVIVACGGWHLRLTRADVVQAMDLPSPVGFVEQDQWEREVTEWPQ